MRQRAVGAGGDDRVEARSLRSQLAHRRLQREDRLALGAPDESLRQQPLERFVGDRARRPDQLDLLRLLDRAQALDQAAAPDQLDPLGQQLRRRAWRSHRNMRVLEPEPHVPRRQRVGDQREQFLGRAQPLEARIDLLCRLLDVPEVGDECPCPGPDQRQAVGARVAGQVAHVDQVGDEQQIDPGLREQRRETIGAVAHPRSSTFSAWSASRYPSGPLPATRATHSSPMTDWRRHVFAGVDVGEVDLDRRQPGELERIADGVGVMRPGSGVEHQPVRKSLQPVQVLDELALVIGLEEPRLEAELPRVLRDLPLELVEGQPP